MSRGSNPLCECSHLTPVNGFVKCERHGMMKTVELWKCCQGDCPTRDCGRMIWSAMESGTLGGVKPANPQPQPPPFCKDGGGRRGCCGGGSLVEQAIERGKRLKSAAVDFWKDGLTIATSSIRRFRKSQCGSCPLLKNGFCDDSTGMGCGCLVWAKRKARAASCPQQKWFAQHDNYDPLVSPVRSMIFHIYPKRGAEWNWHWHIENIRHVAHLFNGKIAIGITHGSGTATPDEVRRLMEGIPVTDWVIERNVRGQDETVTFRKLLSIVKSDDPQAVFFRGHTKGVTHQPHSIEQEWASLMWSTCFDLPSVDDALASHVLAGPLKCQEPLVDAKPWNWFYAGSFYWGRSRPLFEREWEHVEAGRWWAEGWPGYIAQSPEAACLIHDFTDGSVLRPDYWNTIVQPSWKAWRHVRPQRDTFFERPMV